MSSRPEKGVTQSLPDYSSGGINNLYLIFAFALIPCSLSLDPEALDRLRRFSLLFIITDI